MQLAKNILRRDLCGGNKVKIFLIFLSVLVMIDIYLRFDTREEFAKNIKNISEMKRKLNEAQFRKCNEEHSKTKPYPGDRYTLKMFKDFLNNSKIPSVNHHEISNILEPTDMCKNKLDVLFVVHSGVSNQERRDTMRFTIGKYAQKAELKYKLMFIVGITHDIKVTKKVEEESIKSKDILVINVVDSYRNMTYKAVGWIKWISENCGIKPQHIIKMDDDALVKVPALLNLLKPCQRSNASDICTRMSGLVRPKDPTLRTTKNLVTYKEYPLRQYPPFCPGLLYIIPSTVISNLLDASTRVPFLWLDDVYVSTFLRVAIDLKINSLKQYYIEPYIKDYDELYKDKIIAHLSSKKFVTEYVTIWNKMLKSSKSKR